MDIWEYSICQNKKTSKAINYSTDMYPSCQGIITHQYNALL
jgi:hypothetical protein